ncbi:MAG: phosphatidate cytidylyltransferase [Actinobacteria bacterium]|nr:phosphatidate cytidylyltransferase [Actinomycetota bacterium]
MVWKRVLGAVIFGVVFLGTLIWGGLPFTFGIAIAAAIGAVELFSLFESKGVIIGTAALIGIMGSVAYVFLAHFEGNVSYGYVTVGLLLVCFLWYMVVLRHVRSTNAIALTVLAPLITGLCLSHLVLLRDIADVSKPVGKGWVIVIFVVALIWVYDIFAWAVGRKVGRRKIVPAISPNKSLEGMVAGTVAAIAASLLFRYLITWILGNNSYPWLTNGVAVVIGVLVCILGPVGDLAESLIKRDYGVKDTGKIILAHGGIMDRFDSTLFVAPAVYYYLLLFVLT